MKLALECPTELLNDIQPLADFDWVLAHLVLSHPPYAEFYKSSTRFKVLDNSVNELLEPMAIKDLAKAAECVNPDLIVAPDFLGDDEGTIASLIEAVAMFGEDRILPVVQGSELAHVVRCFSYIIDSGFQRVAVPYDILSSRKDSLEVMAANRLEVTNRIISKSPISFQIHLLGMTTIEELSNHNRGWVKSIDTGSPILHGMNYIRYGDGTLLPKDIPTLVRMGVSEGYKNLYYHVPKDIFYNIAYLRKVLNGS